MSHEGRFVSRVIRARRSSARDNEVARRVGGGGRVAAAPPRMYLPCVCFCFVFFCMGAALICNDGRSFSSACSGATATFEMQEGVVIQVDL